MDVKPKMPEGMTEHEQRMFNEASQRHLQFLEFTKKKVHGTNIKAIQENVMAIENLYLQLLNSFPHWEQLIYQLSTLYLQTNRNGLCINLLEPLCLHGPKKLEYLNNLGAAYRNENMNEYATKWFKQALKVDRQADILANLCALYVNEGCPEKGIHYGRECLAKDPKHNQGRWNLGLLLMENGEWEEGFSFYRQGFETGERIIRNYLDFEGKQAPFWNGEDLNGKTIVLHGEQGIGDEMLFLQFVFSLLEKYPEAKVILDVHPRLLKPIERTFKNKKGIQSIYPTRKENPVWNEQERVDYKDGIGSLPAYFWQDMSKYAGWMGLDWELAKEYKSIVQTVQRENNQAGWPVVGISWYGGKKKTRTDLRSIGLHQWGPILNNKCTFISLQYTDDAIKEVSEVYNKTGVRIHHWPDVTQRFDYDHNLALMASCDLVVTVNTSVVHACGSMGYPCWTLTPHGHAWRYGKKEEILPFYKSVTQFHQKEGESWQRNINKVGFQLKYLQGRKS